MPIRRFSANYIFPISSSPIKNGVIETTSNGEIINILSHDENSPEKYSMEFHNGVLVPGFINAHCHLELSHLKGKFKEGTGIAGFISQVKDQRNSNPDDINISIKRAMSTLEALGVVAVGDICNSLDTLMLKKESKIKCFNFIEVFGLNSENAEDIVNRGKLIKNIFEESFPKCTSLTSHATYSISEKMWNLLSPLLADQNEPISIHYGESKEEYELIEKMEGNLKKTFTPEVVQKNLPKDLSPSKLVIKYLPKNKKVLFIHNTFATNEEIKLLKTHFKDSFFVLCPSSNLFIEGVLPDVPMLSELGVDIALGTDSYASSKTLSVFDQMMILLEEYPSLQFHQVLEWATMNGAKALGFDEELGSFEIGKNPGINLITDFDFSNMRPTSKSQIKKIL